MSCWIHDLDYHFTPKSKTKAVNKYLNSPTSVFHIKKSEQY